MLADVNVEVLEGTEVVATGKTNAEGKAEFVLPVSDTYKVVISGLADVYTVEESYSFTDKAVEIVPGSFLPDGIIGRTIVKEGDTMFEFSFQDSDGVTHSLTDLLAEKELVVINFWYSTCQYCKLELPFLMENLEMFEEDMAIIGLNPTSETKEAVAAFKTSFQVTYPLGLVSGKWADTFQLKGYPTSVLVDRNGVVQIIIVGTYETSEEFTADFELFFGDDYDPSVFVEE